MSPALKVAAGWLLGLILVLAAGVTAILVVNSAVYGPQHQVSNYLAALQDGDGSRALGLLNATVPDANPAMLDGAALQESVATLRDVHLSDPVQPAPDRADVTATYELDGQSHETTFHLERTGRQWLFFDTWSMVPGTLPTVDVSVVNQQEATMNGARVVVPGGTAGFAVFYPGRFTAEFSSTYFAAPAVGATVTDRSDGTPTLMLRTGATDQLVDDLTEQIHKFLDGCADQHVLAPTGCPFFYFTDQRVAAPSIDWSITDYPTVAVEPFEGHWVMRQLTGTATLTAQQTDLFTGATAPVSYTQDFTFTARLNVTEANISVTPVIEY